MSVHKKRLSRLRLFLTVLVTVIGIAGCSVFSQQTELLRSDMPATGLKASVTYTLEGNPQGTSEVNQIRLNGMNTESPFPQLTTTFRKVSDTVRTQEAIVTLPDGKPVTALASTSQKITFGLSEWLEVTATTNDFRDAKGQRTCSAKVRMNYKPNAEQFLKGDLGKGWDAIWYYFVPCQNDAKQQLDLANAKFHALVISEQWTPRITGKPLAFNRGRSITIVGGKPASFPSGWWLSNAKKNSDYSILGANKLVRGLVKDIYGDGGKARLSFNPTGPYRDSQLVYSAGDADVFFSVDKVFLNRQTDYVVNFRSDPKLPWTTVYVKPKYNIEWNDWAQGWENFKDFNPLNVDDKLDKNGIPKDPNDPIIKEIETNGCQNCPNATLEQIQIVDANTGTPRYAMTIRGYLGAKNSLVLFGNLPGSGMLSTQLANADAQRQQQQLTCPQRYDDEGKLRPDGEQWSAENCAAMLREGAMWQYLTENPDDFGFDLVGQFNVRDNGTWETACSGGEHSYCWLVPVERKLNAVYMFNTMDTRKPWTAMQLLGEVGVRTLGLSYASDAYAGNGMLFSLAQPLVRDLYYNGLGDNKELIFALDARASQLPGVLGEAGAILK